jgi:hypothetical protein
MKFGSVYEHLPCSFALFSCSSISCMNVICMP